MQNLAPFTHAANTALEGYKKVIPAIGTVFSRAGRQKAPWTLLQQNWFARQRAYRMLTMM